MSITNFTINDRIVRVEGFKKGATGMVVEIPYDGGSEGEDFLGVIWDHNKQAGIQKVDQKHVKLRD